MEKYRSFILLFLILVCISILGTIGFSLLEDITLFDAFWLTMVTVLTVGYGDIVPRTMGGKVFALFIIPLSIAFVTYALGTVTAFIIEGKFSEKVRARKMQKSISNLYQHIVICGLGRVGQQVAFELKKANIPFVVIEKDIEAIDSYSYPVLYIEGEATEDSVLIEAGVERASALIATLPNDADNVFITLTAKGLNPQVAVVARAEKASSEEKLRRAGANDIISPSIIGGKRMAVSVLKPHSVSYVENILHSDQSDYVVGEMELGSNSVLAGQSLKELNIRGKYGVTVVAIKRNGEAIENPSSEERLKRLDLLIIFGHKKQVELFKQLSK